MNFQPTNILKINAPFPEKAAQLFMPSAYKVLHGGRGAAKSWAIARALLILGLHKKLFILCAREIQKSIEESVHKLLSDQIVALGFDAHRGDDGNLIPARYTVKDHEIVGTNGTRFVFAGLRNHTTQIKSMEGIDILWVEEAQFVSQYIWEIIIPTIRKDPPGGPFAQGAEIWLSFNPDLVSDYTYKYWVLDPPAGTIVIEMNWRDNPWFPDILHRQKEEMKRKDYDTYLTIWEGKTRRVLTGAIYAKELAAALLEGRISPAVQWMRSKPVTVAFDLGRADMTSMWFIQQVGMLHNVIDHYENCGYSFDHYLTEMQNRKYRYGRLLLPHDASQSHVSAKNSVESQAREAYPGEGVVKIVPRIAARSLRINAMRTLFPRMCFNEGNCQDGLKALHHYQYEVKAETNKRSNEPLHNWASHAADSIGTYAQDLTEGQLPPPPPTDDIDYGHANHGQGWMQ